MGIGNGQWAMGNGQWAMGISQKLFFSLAPLLPCSVCPPSPCPPCPLYFPVFTRVLESLDFNHHCSTHEYKIAIAFA
ncbi:MAG: hypothetical protein KME30_18780 [Iphinoe sp. HA4291-MV1]|jgi:hypothetical protein|nr:hypothetical protein [Iphinoe sp. HA4291-MV1]